MIQLFTTYIYQPFFNILVGIYWVLDQLFATPDMGIAVIIFALIVRLVLLPVNLWGQRTASEKRKLAQKVKKLHQKLSHDPIKLREEEKKIFKNNPATVASEFITIFIQLIIILMLYRIFRYGLKGADFHLLYDFMPHVPRPLNLAFLGRYDLTKPSLFLNLIQSLAILILESLTLFFAAHSVTKKEVLMLTVFLPVVSFAIFSTLPAGKKLFIITTLLFSTGLLLVRQLVFWYHTWLVHPSDNSPSDQPQPATQEAENHQQLDTKPQNG